MSKRYRFAEPTIDLLNLELRFTGTVKSGQYFLPCCFSISTLLLQWGT